MPTCILFAVEVPIEAVSEQDFEGSGQERIHALANHFGIFRDLFGDAFFYPKIKLKVGYTVKEEENMINPVFHGNKLLPEEVCSPDIILLHMALSILFSSLSHHFLLKYLLYSLMPKKP